MGEDPAEVLNQKVRMWLYFLSAVLLLGLTAYLTADGDYAAAAATFLTSFSALMAGRKTTAKYTITKETGAA